MFVPLRHGCKKQDDCCERGRRYSDLFGERAHRQVPKRRQVDQVDLCVDALAWQQRAAIRTHMTQRVAQQTLIERMAALKAEYGVTVWRVP